MKLSIDDFNLDHFIKKCFDILKKEIRYLQDKSSDGKLSTNNTRDLVTYIKLLSELEKSQQEFLGKMSSEQLLKILESKNESPPGES